MASKDTHYCLSKATKRLKDHKNLSLPSRYWKVNGPEMIQDKQRPSPGTWKLFCSHPRETSIATLLNDPHQLQIPIKIFRLGEVQDVIKYNLIPTRAPGNGLITGRVLKELPPVGTNNNSNNSSYQWYQLPHNNYNITSGNNNDLKCYASPGLLFISVETGSENTCMKTV